MQSSWDVQPKNGLDAFFTLSSFEKFCGKKTLQESILYRIEELKTLCVTDTKVMSSTSFGSSPDAKHDVSISSGDERQKQEDQDTAYQAVDELPTTSTGDKKQSTSRATKRKERLEALQAKCKAFNTLTAATPTRKSTLTWHEQKLYLMLSAKYLGSFPKDPTEEEIIEIRELKSLQQRVEEEQKLFQQYLNKVAQTRKNDYQFVHPEAQKYLKEKLSHCQRRVENYPKYYDHHDSIEITPSDSPQQAPVLTYIKTLLELGEVPKMLLPNLTSGARPPIKRDYESVSKNFPASVSNLENIHSWNHEPCSRDKNAEMLACKHACQIVLSGSALKCLMDSQSDTSSNNWEIPFSVKEYHRKDGEEVTTVKIIYIDKPFLSKNITTREENVLFHKYALRSQLIQKGNKAISFTKPRHGVAPAAGARSASMNFGNNLTCEIPLKMQMSDSCQKPGITDSLKKQRDGNVMFSGRQCGDILDTSTIELHAPLSPLHKKKKTDSNASVEKTRAKNICTSKTKKKTNSNMSDSVHKGMFDTGYNLNIDDLESFGTDSRSTRLSFSFSKRSKQTTSQQNVLDAVMLKNKQICKDSFKKIKDFAPNPLEMKLQVTGKDSTNVKPTVSDNRTQHISDDDEGHIECPKTNMMEDTSCSKQTDVEQCKSDEFSIGDDSKRSCYDSDSCDSDKLVICGLGQEELRDSCSPLKSFPSDILKIYPKVAKDKNEDTCSYPQQINADPLLDKPASPDIGDPVSPDIGEPASPDIGDPASPDIGEPASPDIGEPASPDSPLSPPFQMSLSALPCKIIPLQRQSDMDTEEETEVFLSQKQNQNEIASSGSSVVQEDVSPIREIGSDQAVGTNNDSLLIEVDNDEKSVTYSPDISSNQSRTGRKRKSTEKYEIDLDTNRKPNVPARRSLRAKGKKVCAAMSIDTSIPACHESTAINEIIICDTPDSPSMDNSTVDYVTSTPIKEEDKDSNSENDAVHASVSPVVKRRMSRRLAVIGKLEHLDSVETDCMEVAKVDSAITTRVEDKRKSRNSQVSCSPGSINTKRKASLAAAVHSPIPDVVEDISAKRLTRSRSKSITQSPSEKSPVVQKEEGSAEKNDMPVVPKKRGRPRKVPRSSSMKENKQTCLADSETTTGTVNKQPENGQNVLDDEASTAEGEKINIDMIIILSDDEEKKSENKKLDHKKISDEKASTAEVEKINTDTTITVSDDKEKKSPNKEMDDKKTPKQKPLMVSDSEKALKPSQMATKEPVGGVSPLDAIMNMQQKMLKTPSVSDEKASTAEVEKINTDTAITVSDDKVKKSPSKKMDDKKTPKQKPLMVSDSEKALKPSQMSTKEPVGGISPLDAIMNMQQEMLKTPSAEGASHAHEREDPASYLHPTSHNITYHLWTFNGMQLLIRCNYHGAVRNLQQQMNYVYVSPKLEYQTAHGHEQMTTSEISRNWISVYIRPNCRLLQARINAMTSEILLMEEAKLQQLIPQNSSFRPNTSFLFLQNILKKLEQLPPGDFLLNHKVGEDCCTILKSTDNNRRGAYNLHFSYLGFMSINSSEEPTQWIPIEPNIVTSQHLKNGRIPATFEPIDYVNVSKPQKKKRKNKKN